MRKAMMSQLQLATQWLRGQCLSPGNRHTAPHCRAGVGGHPNTGCSPSQALPIVFTGIQGEAIKSGERLSAVLTHKRTELVKSTSTWATLRNAATMWHLFPLLQRKFTREDGTLGDDSCFSACWLPSVCTAYKRLHSQVSGMSAAFFFFLDLFLFHMYKCLPVCY